MEKVDGKNAVLEINMPALNKRNAKVKRPIATPNSRHTDLKEKKNTNFMVPEDADLLFYRKHMHS